MYMYVHMQQWWQGWAPGVLLVRHRMELFQTLVRGKPNTSNTASNRHHLTPDTIAPSKYLQQHQE
jgi:hypothetical protein